MTDKQLLEQALSCLEESYSYVQEDAENAERLYGKYPTRQARIQGLKDEARKHWDVITAIRARLEQPAKEPVAWPTTASEVSDFIGSSYVWREHKISDVEPHDDDKYCVTAHDLIEAFEAWADTRPQPAAPAIPEGREQECEQLMTQIGVLRSQLLGMRMEFGEGSTISNLAAALAAEDAMNIAAAPEQKGNV